MFRSHKLKPHSGRGQVLEFEWDPQTGDLRGAGAPTVRSIAEQALAAGSVLIDPYPTVYDIEADPLTSEEAMAAILGAGYRLDAVLQQSYPKTDSGDLPEGALA